MRNRNLISMIYTSLEKTSAAVEKLRNETEVQRQQCVVPVRTHVDAPQPAIPINNTNAHIALQVQ
jgi:hypothetical protein